MINELNRIKGAEAKILQRHMLQRPVKIGALAKELGVSIKISSLGTESRDKFLEKTVSMLFA